MSVFWSHSVYVLHNGSLSRLRHLGIKIMALTQHIILQILPSQAQPCLIKPTIRDVHWWHLVGAVKLVRKNWWVLIYKAKRPNMYWRLNNLEKVILVIHSNHPVQNIILYTKKSYSLPFLPTFKILAPWIRHIWKILSKRKRREKRRRKNYFSGDQMFISTIRKQINKAWPFLCWYILNFEKTLSRLINFPNDSLNNNR